jgi:hypothetical protein
MRVVPGTRRIQDSMDDCPIRRKGENIAAVMRTSPPIIIVAINPGRPVVRINRVRLWDLVRLSSHIVTRLGSCLACI